MYRSFYGLAGKPFDLTPQGGLVYLSDSHREGLAILRYGVIADKGFLLLTGGVGTGKTTLLKTLLGMLPPTVNACVLSNPALTRNELYHYLAESLELFQVDDKAEFLLGFTRLLTSYQDDGRKLLLIIDEAQTFSDDLLEEIRLLSNNAEGGNVLSIFLVGQSELLDKLTRPQLLPLRQRIGIRYHLEPLTREETEQYIMYRLQNAGWKFASPFNDQATSAIHSASSGNPRLINVICDNALLFGFIQEKRVLGKSDIAECLKTVMLQGEERLPVSQNALSQTKDNPYTWRGLTTGLAGRFFSGILAILAGVAAVGAAWYLTNTFKH